MRYAYADPPYPGLAHLYNAEAAADGRRSAEVNHQLLIAHLCDEFDGWALSTSSTALAYVLELCPADVRIGAWVKPWASFKKGVNPAYAWEPVIFWGARTWKERGGAASRTTRDWVACHPLLRKGFVGCKPPEMIRWVLDLLGVTPEDEFVDLFPGSGAVGRAHQEWLNARPLDLVEAPPEQLSLEEGSPA